MTIKIQKIFLDYDKDNHTYGMIFLPANLATNLKQVAPTYAIFTHGYTSHKGNLFNWATRLADLGVATAIFDLPGHYLGNYSEVTDFEYFKIKCPQLFLQALLNLKKYFPYQDYNENDTTLILGGHSLGALFSLKAMDLSEFSAYKKINLSVGLGMAPLNAVHIYDTPFYKSTLVIREQLVSPAINANNIFPWIKWEKENLNLTNHRIILLSGKDDMVAPHEGVKRFADLLSSKGNNVSVVAPEKLPHHAPENAGPHIKKILQDEGIL